MYQFLTNIFGQPSTAQLEFALTFVRVGIGLLTIGHGIPKMAGVEVWQNLGTTFMHPLGITFLPVMWGFLGAMTEFVGGIALVMGLGTRIASFALIIMMSIATMWHIKNGDSFLVYSYPISLIVVFIGFLIIGGGIYSFDFYLV